MMEVVLLRLGWRKLGTSRLLVPGWQQVRFYQPRKLTKQELDKLHRVTKPFIPSADSPHVQEWQLKPEVQKSYKREAWAKFGSASGVDWRELLPTKEEMEEEWEAEKRWWPSLKEMQDAIKKENEIKEQERLAYEKRVAENMAKMPKWIEKWEAERKQEQEREEQRATKRELLKEKAMEELEYKYSANSLEVKEYLKDMIEKERMDKKKSKKLAKLARSKS